MIAVLRPWDYRWAADSIATTLAIYWAAGPRNTDAQRLQSLVSAMLRLYGDFGHWQVPWGQANRFQRLDDAISPTFDDTKPSIPVPFVSATYGSLASYPGARRRHALSLRDERQHLRGGRGVRAYAARLGGKGGR